MTIKKLLAGLISASMLTALVPVMTASAADDYIFNYTFEEGEAGDTSVISGSNALYTPSITTESDGNRYLTVTTSGTVARGEMLYINSNLTKPAEGVPMESGKAYEIGYSFRIEAPKSGADYSLFQTGMMYPNGAGGAATIRSWNASGVNAFRVYASTNQGTFNTTDFVKVVEQYMPTGNENEFERTFFLYQKNSSGEFVKKLELKDTTIRKNMTAFKYWSSSAYAKGTYEYKLHLDDIYMRKLPVYPVVFSYNDTWNTPQTTIQLSSDLDGNVTCPTVDPDYKVLDEGSTTGTDTFHKMVFDGWYTKDDEAFDGTGINDSMLDADDIVQIHAKWKDVYRIIYDAGDGLFFEDTSDESDLYLYEIDKGATEISDEIPAPKRANYKFSGWFTEPDGEGEAISDVVADGVSGNIRAYAYWKQGEKVVYHDIDENGKSIKSYTEYPLGAFEDFEIPTPDAREDWEFIGWYPIEVDTLGEAESETTYKFVAGGEKVEAGTPVTGAATFGSKWKKMLEITLETNGGDLGEEKDVIYVIDTSADIETIDVESLPVPIKVGSNFEGWYTDQKLTIPFDGTLSKDIILYAGYDNILFSESFEYKGDELTEMSQKYIREMAGSTNISTWLSEGSGIVVDPEDKNNLVLCVTGTGKLEFPFTNGGPGIYEFSMRIKQDGGTGKLYPLTAASGENAWETVSFYNDEIIMPNTSAMAHRIKVWNSTSIAATGWVDVMVRYDTEKGIVDCYADWYGRGGATESGYKEGYSVTNTADYIDTAIFDYYQSNGGKVYIDDYEVKKIEQVDIAEVYYLGSNKQGNDQKDISVNTQIKVLFTDRIDEGTINKESVYLSYEDGGKVKTVPATVSADAESGKTYAVIKPDEPLLKGTKYTINATDAVIDDLGYYLWQASEKYTFTTEPDDILATAKSITAKTNEADSSNVDVEAVINIRNYQGEATESFMVSGALENTTGNKQEAIKVQQVTVAKDKTDVDNSEDVKVVFTIPKADMANYKVNFFVWDSFVWGDSQSGFNPYSKTIELAMPTEISE